MLRQFIGKSKIRTNNNLCNSTILTIPAAFKNITGISLGTECNLYLLDEKNLLIEPIVETDEDTD